MHTSLSQGAVKRFNGKATVDANVSDIRSRSTYRHNSTTGCVYAIVNRHNDIIVEFGQTGKFIHSEVRRATVGVITPSGYVSHGTIAIENAEISWFDLAEFIGMNPTQLMATVRKFAKTQDYVTSKSSRDRYNSAVGNRRKQDKANKNIRGIRIC